MHSKCLSNTHTHTINPSKHKNIRAQISISESEFLFLLTMAICIFVLLLLDVMKLVATVVGSCFVSSMLLVFLLCRWWQMLMNWIEIWVWSTDRKESKRVSHWQAEQNEISIAATSFQQQQQQHHFNRVFPFTILLIYNNFEPENLFSFLILFLVVSWKREYQSIYWNEEVEQERERAKNCYHIIFWIL